MTVTINDIETDVLTPEEMEELFLLRSAALEAVLLDDCSKPVSLIIVDLYNEFKNHLVLKYNLQTTGDEDE